MTKRSSAWFAFSASFAVYFFPIVTAHGVWLLAQVLFQKQPGQSARWTAVNWAVALFLQLLAAGSLYWFFSRPEWRRGVWLLLAVPFLFWSLLWTYLVEAIA